MSYQVLARKWRPKAFQDMVGQEPILRMLSNALLKQRIHHAYLFTGTRGVGKTTLARIIAKCLNCETGITSNPCGQCKICQAIDTGQFLDLFEVDAASRTKVEDTRELLDNVLYPPSQGRYKIYLIDEVHMLSNHSFNALLKTLEEPPEHVKFLLATTDPKKLPVTVLSRCLQFHLKRISPELIAKHLQHICITEKISFELPALEKLAKAADGSMRDALSLLDQAIAYGQGEVTKEDVNSMLGSIAQEDLLPLLQALSKQDNALTFKLVQELSESAPDFYNLFEEFINLLHKIAIEQILPKTLSDDALSTLAKQFKPEEIQLYYQIALLSRRDLTLNPNPQQGFEMAILRMLAFKPVNSAPSKTTIPQETIVNSTSKQAEKIVELAQPTQDIPDWRALLPKLNLSGMAQALASNCILQHIGENKVEFALAAHHQPMLNSKLEERIAEALSRYLGRPVQLDIKITTAELFTPVKQQQHEQQQKLIKAKETVLQDPRVKQLIDMYDATVEVSLVKT